MRDRRQERRALFEAILADPHASHTERLKADDALRELELEEHRVTAVDRLTPEQAAEELASLAAALPGMIAVAAGPDAVVPPDDPSQLLEVVELQEVVIARLECRLGERERALQRMTVQRLLPPAPRVAL